MKAVEILMGEHVVIREFLNVLANGVQQIGTNRPPPPEFFTGAIEFCRLFADKAHHYKEEHVMFGLLAQKHEGRIDAQIARHRDQHERCRDLLHEISEAVSGYAAGNSESTRLLTNRLAEYVTTLRKHIVSEDEVFFPMVEVFLSDEDGDRLLEEFAKYDDSAGFDSWERARESVEEMDRMLSPA